MNYRPHSTKFPTGLPTGFEELKNEFEDHLGGFKSTKHQQKFEKKAFMKHVENMLGDFKHQVFEQNAFMAHSNNIEQKAFMKHFKAIHWKELWKIYQKLPREQKRYVENVADRWHTLGLLAHEPTMLQTIGAIANQDSDNQDNPDPGNITLDGAVTLLMIGVGYAIVQSTGADQPVLATAGAMMLGVGLIHGALGLFMTAMGSERPYQDARRIMVALLYAYGRRSRRRRTIHRGRYRSRSRSRR